MTAYHPHLLWAVAAAAQLPKYRARFGTVLGALLAGLGLAGGHDPLLHRTFLLASICGDDATLACPPFLLCGRHLLSIGGPVD